MHDWNEPAFQDPYRNGYGSGAPEEEEASVFPPGMEHRLLSSLMAQERYGDMDKAKHNPHYMSYLLENGEGEMPF